MKIRIKFAKYGAMKFIGHLDVMRFFQKAIRRADIDIKYTEGFSPHQMMSFAAPLGVGIESVGEYLDIEVNAVTSTEMMKKRLNEVMVEGIEIVSVKALPDTAKNAMASVAAAAYRILFLKIPALEEELSHVLDIGDIVQKLEAFYAQDKIPVTKKTKKNVVELDLKPCIYELKAEEGCIDPFSQNLHEADSIQSYLTLSMLVNASSSGNIKPTMVLDAFCAYCHAVLPPYAYRIIRMDTYTEAKQEERTFIPLEAVGKDL